jgi:orotate phosphoribosyltransferase
VDGSRPYPRCVTTDLHRDVYDACHLTGEFTLRSGQVAHEYFDKYLFESDPVLLRRVGEAMVALLPDCDVLGGMEMGGIPLVAVMSQITGLPAVFVRKSAKEYGTRKAAEGIGVAGRRVVAVEDVVTTAGALVNGCLLLREAGAVIDTAVCAIDREQGGPANLTEVGVTLRPALRRADLDSVAASTRSQAG